MSNSAVVTGLNDAIDRLDSKGVQDIILRNRDVLTPADLNKALERVMANTAGDPGRRVTIIKRLRDAGATD